MHHHTDRIIHTTAFVTPVVEHWLEREIAQWVHHMKDQSNNPSHHERMLLPLSYISLCLDQRIKKLNEVAETQMELDFCFLQLTSTCSLQTVTRLHKKKKMFYLMMYSTNFIYVGKIRKNKYFISCHTQHIFMVIWH